jgi:hypothetical protein
LPQILLEAALSKSARVGAKVVGTIEHGTNILSGDRMFLASGNTTVSVHSRPLRLMRE